MNVERGIKLSNRILLLTEHGIGPQIWFEQRKWVEMVDLSCSGREVLTENVHKARSRGVGPADANVCPS